MKLLGKIMCDILTGADNTTFDHGRVLSLLSTLIYCGLSISEMAKHGVFDYMNFAGGLSTIAVAFGVQIKLKQSTEPPPQ